MSGDNYSISILYDGKILSKDMAQNIKNILKSIKYTLLRRKLFKIKIGIQLNTISLIKISNNLHIIPPWEK